MRSRSTWSGWLALALLALATMEFAARLDDWVRHRAPLMSNDSFERLFDFDGQVVRGVPHARYAKWHLNSLGMRGPEPDRAGAVPVLVLGASETFGLYEDDGREFPREIERALDAAAGAGRYQVFNAGVPGMRIGSGTAYLKELAARIHPAIVVLYPTPTHYIGVRQPNCGRPARARDPLDTWPRSRLAQKTSDRAKVALPRSMMHRLRQVAIAWETRGEPVLERIEDTSLTAMQVDLTCAIDAVRAIGARPVLVTHANRFGARTREDDAIWLTGWRMQYPVMREAGFLDLEQRANRLIAEVAERGDLTLVDADKALGGRHELFRDHAHFSNEGAAELGNLIAAALIRGPASRPARSRDTAPPPVNGRAASRRAAAAGSSPPGRRSAARRSGSARTAASRGRTPGGW